MGSQPRCATLKYTYQDMVAWCVYLSTNTSQAQLCAEP